MRSKTKRPNLNRGQAGDTLISIILSVAVISLVIVIAYILISNSLRLSQQAREREQVRNLVQGQIESLKYLVFNDGDHHVFNVFNPSNPLHPGQSSDPFCLVDAPVSADPQLKVSALLLNDSTKEPESDADQISRGNELKPAHPWPDCVTFAGLEAADVKIWITYDREGMTGTTTDGDEEHLFKIEARWDGIRGGEERMEAALRLSPPGT
ncbi:type II secretion system protein [Candidatus Saccharibacteria bacterium]|nr:type II secretion system protein [Candidatus Saccharibacteria bacterium]